MPILAAKTKGHDLIVSGRRIPRALQEARAVLREIATHCENSGSKLNGGNVKNGDKN
ncbi:MAG: hypothetical protein GX493_03470 [Firmicutes bacterium]|nr:hypothetical protein [Bacillota bacterium]